jgi:hypothetical protein
MSAITCTSVSVYSGSLTRGRIYEVLANDDVKRQVRVKDDRGRSRWFPLYCFASDIQPVSTLVRFHVDDPRDLAEGRPVEVTVEHSDGSRRWCVFTTPEALTASGDWIEGTKIPFHYGNGHIILAAELSEDLIGRMLHEIDRQGKLEACTLPLAGGL